MSTQKNEPEIKPLPCPFCGVIPDFDGEHVECVNGECPMPMHRIRVGCWNRRITPPTDTTGSGREGETWCGPKSGHCAECGTTEGALVLLEDTTLCEECNMADHVVKLRLIDELTAQLEALRRDGERLEWVMEFITENGTDALANLPWTNLADTDPMAEDELVFDRAAIDSAQRQEGR